VLDEVIFRLIFNDYQVGTKARAVRLTTRNLLLLLLLLLFLFFILSFLFTILAD